MAMWNYIMCPLETNPLSPGYATGPYASVTPSFRMKNLYAVVNKHLDAMKVINRLSVPILIAEILEIINHFPQESKRELSFEDYLSEKFVSNYHGTKDTFENDFTNWLDDFQIDDWFKYGKEYRKHQTEV